MLNHHACYDNCLKNCSHIAIALHPERVGKSLCFFQHLKGVIYLNLKSFSLCLDFRTRVRYSICVLQPMVGYKLEILYVYGSWKKLSLLKITYQGFTGFKSNNFIQSMVV